jgi:hypothetical protein
MPKTKTLTSSSSQAAILKDFQQKVRENGGRISPKDFKKQLYGIHYWNNQQKGAPSSKSSSGRGAAETTTATHQKNASSLDQKHPIFTFSHPPTTDAKNPIISTLVLDLEKEDLRQRAQKQADKPLSPAVQK